MNRIARVLFAAALLPALVASASCTRASASVPLTSLADPAGLGFAFSVQAMSPTVKAAIPLVVNYPKPIKYTKRAVVKVETFGDSTTYGVGAATKAAYRTYLYYAAQDAGTPLFFVGTLAQGGTGSDGGVDAGRPGLIDPWNEGNSGATAESISSFIPVRFGSPGGPTSTGYASGQGRPDVVIWLAGTNSLDPTVKSPVDSPSTLVNTVISGAMDLFWSYRDPQKPWFKIVVCEIMPRLDAVDTDVQTANGLLPAMIAGKSYASSVLLIHNYSALPKDPAYFESVPAVSQVHPNDAGYDLEGQAIWTGNGQGQGLRDVLTAVHAAM